MLSKRKMRLIILAVIVVVLATYILSGLNTSLDISSYTYTSSKIPPEFDGLKIVQISDFHNKDFGDRKAEFYNTLAALEPDIIFLTGDLIDKRNHEISATRELLEMSSRLAPSYFVIGNHELAPERAADYDMLKQWMMEFGIVELNDQTVELTSGSGKIKITGQLYRSIYISEYLMQPDTENFNILLYHGADKFETLSAAGYDLIFAGHLHGGIIRLPFVGGILSTEISFFPKYDGGIYKLNDSTMICSRGIGDSYIPRLHNNSEIVILTLDATS